MLQRLLVHRGLKIGVDGTFGPETEAAVKTFQSSQKLDADGMVGDLTWPAVLGQVKKGDEDEAVTAAQKLLVPRLVGLLDLEVDGTFGPDTDRGVRAYQKAAGFGVDGIVGPETWHGLIWEDPSP